MSGGYGEDQQKLKRIAAAAYDYDNDARWPDYWSNVLIPPHMASRNDVVEHFKSKFYQRYIDNDLIVEPMVTNNSSQTARASAQPPQSSSSATGPSSRTSGTSTTPPSNSTPLRWDPQTIQFSANAWIFVVAVLAIFPLVPKSLSSRAYRLSFLGTACSSLYSLYALYGKPRAWNIQALQVWFQSVVTTKDFIHSIYCLSFVTSNLCLKFALIPILCWALEHVAKFLRHNFRSSTLYRKYLELGRGLCLGRVKHNHPKHSLFTSSDWTWIPSCYFPFLVAAQYYTSIYVLAEMVVQEEPLEERDPQCRKPETGLMSVFFRGCSHIQSRLSPERIWLGAGFLAKAPVF